MLCILLKYKQDAEQLRQLRQHSIRLTQNTSIYSDHLDTRFSLLEGQLRPCPSWHRSLRSLRNALLSLRYSSWAWKSFASLAAAACESTTRGCALADRMALNHGWSLPSCRSRRLTDPSTSYEYGKLLQGRMLTCLHETSECTRSN